jgi:hypothetical protein
VDLKQTTPSIEELADVCLQHFTQNPDQLAEFMVQSGLTPENLRRLAGTTGFAQGLVDYVVSNEALLLEVAGASKIKPETFTAAWARMHRHEA